LCAAAYDEDFRDCGIILSRLLLNADRRTPDWKTEQYEAAAGAAKADARTCQQPRQSVTPRELPPHPSRDQTAYQPVIKEQLGTGLTSEFGKRSRQSAAIYIDLLATFWRRACGGRAKTKSVSGYDQAIEVAASHARPPELDP
jgi:hypothetical protein